MSKSGFIAIVGRPNAGKSTLLNAILGTKVSIVTPKAQTTRERVLGILTEKKGQIVFIDTPGIHNAKEGGINAFMMSEAREALDAPSAVWYLVDPASELKHEAAVLALLEKSPSPVILLMNKMDRVPSGRIAGIEMLEHEIQQAMEGRGIALKKVMRISAQQKQGLDELMRESWAHLPEGPFYYPDEEQISDRPTRFFVAEKIREQLLLQLGDEIPYSCAVEIERYLEPEPPAKNARPEITRIEAVIHVERDSQKGMVIGKAGAKIKEIGQAARLEIEEFIGARVFLGLKVKVLKDWSRDAEALKRMGYNLPDPGSGKKKSREKKSS